ncbi:MAG: hypothetical protein ABID32_05825 [Candidatus Omnitrophota bacterium]
MEKTEQIKKISKVNTKQEIMDAYNVLLKQLEEKEKTELKPEEKKEKIKNEKVIKDVDALSTEGVVKGTANLKMEIGRMLSGLSDRLEEETDKYTKIKEAIEIKEKELQEIYEIEKEAKTLSALIEAQSQKNEEFENEMCTKKTELDAEINTKREEWKNEKEIYEFKIKEEKNEEEKKKKREKEGYEYLLKRQQQIIKDKFEDEKANQEKELLLAREEIEKEFDEREKQITEKETEINELRKKSESFSKETNEAVKKAVDDIREKLEAEARNREELSKRAFEGERNVLISKIESLENTVKEQKTQINNLSQQLEKAYQKVQDIAVKAVGGFSDFKLMNKFQNMETEQVKKQPLKDNTKNKDRPDIFCYAGEDKRGRDTKFCVSTFYTPMNIFS